MAWAVLAAPVGGEPIGLLREGPPRVTVAVENDQPTALPESQWTIVAPLSDRGVTVAWTASPFQSATDRQLLADASLSLRLIQAGKRGGWKVRVPTARTEFAKGRKLATVVAESAAPDVTRAGITVVFRGSENPLLTAGAYQTELIATITEN